MDEPIQDSDPARIVGFESQPIPTSNLAELKNYGLIGVGIAFVIFLFVIPSAPSVGSPAKKQEKKYVAPATNNKAYRSAKEAREAVENYVDQQMKKNQDVFDSLKNR